MKEFIQGYYDTLFCESRDWNTIVTEALITFGDKNYPNFGQVVIVAGGSGSGKGFVIDNLFGINGKRYDVDYLKQEVRLNKEIRKMLCEKYGVEDYVDPSCIECYPIIGLDSTYIDHDYSLIYTTVQECSEFTEIIGVSETATTITIASHIFGNYEFLGTGTIISVYDNDVHIGDYTLIVSGDVNGDSVCDVLDCAQVALVANGHKTLDYYYERAADVCYDEVIDIFDYQDIVNIALAS